MWSKILFVLAILMLVIAIGCDEERVAGNLERGSKWSRTGGELGGTMTGNPLVTAGGYLLSVILGGAGAVLRKRQANRADTAEKKADQEERFKADRDDAIHTASNLIDKLRNSEKYGKATGKFLEGLDEYKRELGLWEKGTMATFDAVRKGLNEVDKVLE